MNSGKTLSILANIVQPEEEIVGIKLYLNHKKLLVCDNKGHLFTSHLPTGLFYTEN